MGSAKTLNEPVYFTSKELSSHNNHLVSNISYHDDCGSFAQHCTVQLLCRLAVDYACLAVHTVPTFWRKMATSNVFRNAFRNMFLQSL